MTDAEYFMEVMGKHYEEYIGKMRKLCSNAGVEFDYDVFADTVIKIHERIERQGFLYNKTEQGCLNYFFRAFIMNMRREGQYAYRAKTSLSDEMGKYDGLNITSDEKVEKDLKEDFSVYYILNKAQENVDDESFHLFNLKFLGHYTYKELQQHTNAKAVRQKVSSVKRWIKENISKTEVEKAYEEFRERVKV